MDETMKSAGEGIASAMEGLRRKQPLVERSDTFGKIAVALAQAQAEFTEVEKNCVAKITSQRGASYSFEYADLAAINTATRPALTKHGLAILAAASTQDAGTYSDREGNAIPLVRISVQTELIHGESGEWFRTPLLEQTIEAGEAKDLAGLVTYFRRYQISALLQIAAEEDKDAGGAGERKDRVQQPAPAPGAGNFRCRFGEKHATGPEARDCKGHAGAPSAESGPFEAPRGEAPPPAEGFKDLPPAEGQQTLPAEPRVELEADEARKQVKAAIKAKDWTKVLAVLPTIPPGPERKVLEDEYLVARQKDRDSKKGAKP